MKEDGTMMRTSELKAFAEKHGIPTMTIKELQEYRKVKEILVSCEAVTKMPTKYGLFTAYCLSLIQI